LKRHQFWILRAAAFNDLVAIVGVWGDSNLIGFFICLKQKSPFLAGYIQRSLGWLRFFMFAHSCICFTDFFDLTGISETSSAGWTEMKKIGAK
jgi:hypothetical protein